MTLLLSIKPDFVERIFSGQKSVELRKRRPKVQNGTTLVIYSTAPVSQIVGFASVQGIEVDTPRGLWSRVQPLCGVTKAEYDAYFQNSSQSVGIYLGQPRLFTKQFSLEQLRELWPGFHPPQQFKYLQPEQSATLFAAGDPVRRAA